MSNYYVLLTGSKNNAGDYLIKQRAKSLLTAYRPDRELVDMDGWKPLTDEQLNVVNSSAALLLTGGPAVNTRMRPVVYALRENLDDIGVPITTFGVGWRSPDGRWSRTNRFGFNEASKQLLQRIEGSGLQASVRDFHTQNVLHHSGLTRVLMTGCPALYSVDHLGRQLDVPATIERVSISLGVHFVRSRTLEEQSRELVRAVQDAFPEAQVNVAFHHSLDERYAAAYGKTTPVYKAQRRFLAWLEEQGVGHVDLSGSADRLVHHYGDTDVHVGYRVHAHIYMTSIRKPSLLLAEDGRGMALKDVLGGHIVDAFERYDDSKALKAARRLGFGADSYNAAPGLAYDVVRNLSEDAANGWPRARAAVASLEGFAPSMRNFTESLP